MKACPICGRLYPPDAGFCPVDGSELTSATQAPIPSTDDDPRVGDILLERYQIRRVVADGGMGRVYEALDLVEQRNLAIKCLHADVAKDQVAVERFKREFEVSKQLPHDHIVEVMDFQPTPDGTYALAMEFLYGEELRNTLKRENVISSARVVRMVSQVAIGLDESHARKFVHRDLKPDNIFLCQTPDGDISKILDFGSVKDKGESAKKLTVLGTTIGSPYYMAPEQAQGLDTLDQRADVWALAAIVYECISSEVPFQGNNGPSILLEILTKEPIPVSQRSKDQKYPAPPTVDAVMANAFKKSAAVRTPSIGAFADALGRAYGLEGDHFAWAKTPESQLQAQIDQKLPELMVAVPVAAPVDAAADGFFGEGDSLGAGLEAPTQLEIPAPPPPQAPAPAPMVPQPGPPMPMAAPGAGDDVPLQVPTTGGKWLIPAVVGGIALVFGILIVLFVMD